MPGPTSSDATFAESWTHAELDSAAPASQTMHRRLSTPPPEAEDLPALLIGPQLGLHELELIGEGGMASVVAARDDVLQRTVALKRPRADMPPAVAHALVREARTLAMLDHPNIVPVYALGRDGTGAPVVAMKRVIGRPWTELLAEGRDLDRDLDILLEVADALRFAHDRGTLHRDVKPDNVMVGRFGEVYLMDWGCACPIGGARTTQVVGTPAYMAPEMLCPGAAIGPATDVFLLGATLHAALTGQPRHAGDNLRAVLEVALAPKPVSYGPDVPEELAEIINRACAADPAARQGSVDDLAAALRTFVRHREANALAASALAGLPALQQAIAEARPEADGLFDELRVTLRSALQAWPESERAARGLTTATEAYVSWKIATGELTRAAALLPDLDPPGRERCEAALAAARARREREAARLKAHDLSTSAREQRLSVGILVVTLTVVVGGVVLGKGGDALTPGQLAALGPVTVLLVVFAFLPFRGALGRSHAFRMFVIGLTMTTIMATLHRAAAMLAGTPPRDTVRAEALMYALTMIVLGIGVDRALLLTAVPFLLSAAAMLVWPESATQIFGPSALCAVAIGAMALMRRAREGDRG